MEEKDFVAAAIKAGFSPSQAAFLWTAQKHSHLSEDIIVDPEDGETLNEFVDAVSEALADEGAAEGEEETEDEIEA